MNITLLVKRQHFLYFNKMKHERKFTCTIENKNKRKSLAENYHFQSKSQRGWKFENKAIESWIWVSLIISRKNRRIRFNSIMIFLERYRDKLQCILISFTEQDRQRWRKSKIWPWMYYTRIVCDIAIVILIETCYKSKL